MKLRVKHDWFFGGVLCLHNFWTRNLDQLLSPSTPSHVLFPGLSRYSPGPVMLLSFVVLQWLPIIWRIEFRHHRAIACLAPPLSHPVLQPEWTRWCLGLALPSAVPVADSSAGMPFPELFSKSTLHLSSWSIHIWACDPLHLSGLRPQFTCSGKPYLTTWHIWLCPPFCFCIY